MKTTQHLALAALLALSTLSGAALAGPMPVGGEGPLVLDQPLVSTSSRAEVRAEALAHPPVHGGQSLFADAPVAKDHLPSRAEVRAQTRDAVAHGNFPAIGEMS